MPHYNNVLTLNKIADKLSSFPREVPRVSSKVHMFLWDSMSNTTETFTLNNFKLSHVSVVLHILLIITLYKEVYNNMTHAASQYR